MKQVDVSKYVIVKSGVEFKIRQPFRMSDLIPHMERQEAYIFWLQPISGDVTEQEASVKINNVFYLLNSKLEKAIFRDRRLTRDFINREKLIDGTSKLLIPSRLMREKMRTSRRVSRFSCKQCMHAMFSLLTLTYFTHLQNMTNAQAKNQLNKSTHESVGVKKLKKDKKKKANARLNTLMTTIQQAFKNNDTVFLHTSADILREQLKTIYKKEYPNSNLCI